jgi:hypothetical protein
VYSIQICLKVIALSGFHCVQKLQVQIIKNRLSSKCHYSDLFDRLGVDDFFREYLGGDGDLSRFTILTTLGGDLLAFGGGLGDRLLADLEGGVTVVTDRSRLIDRLGGVSDRSRLM